jgi:hypothetical protein
MPYNVISTTYISKFKINSNTEIEVFYKDKEFVSVSEVYKVQYNSNGIIRQLIGNTIKLNYKSNLKGIIPNLKFYLDIDSFDVLKDGIIVDINDEHDENDDDDEDDKDAEDDKLINMPSSFVICKENLKTSLLDCEEKWKSLSYEKRVEFYTTYKAELNIKT